MTHADVQKVGILLFIILTYVAYNTIKIYFEYRSAWRTRRLKEWMWMKPQGVTLEQWVAEFDSLFDAWGCSIDKEAYTYRNQLTIWPYE